MLASDALVPPVVLSFTSSPVLRATSTEAIKLLIDQKAEEYSVSSSTLHKIVRCESGYRWNAVGDNGKSFGLVQIYRPAHPTITKEQAFDPEFSIDFLAKNVSKGNAGIWSCYRMITALK